WFLGWQIEQRFGREQALEWLLNTTYYGHLAYGVEAAARLTFDVGAAELTPAEAALLAAIGRDPAANPFDDPAAARAGAASVLATMAARGWADAADSSTDALARLAPPPGSDSIAPAFARLTRAELERLLGPARLVGGGYQVETTLDLPLQAAAACVAAAGQGEPVGGGPPCPAAAALTDEPSAEAAAVVILDVPTGAIVALAGDAPLTARPVGTLARPFIALSALSQGYTAASLTYDVEQIYLQDGQPYVPPDDGDDRGPLRLREALAAGRAAPATQMLGWVGVARVLENAGALGVMASDATSGLAFAQEGFSADLLSLSHAFAALGNGGTLAGAPGAERPRPATIRRVLDVQGSEVYALGPETRDVVSPELAWLLTDMLRADAGGAALATGRAAAGDDWAVGLSPERLVGVWAGGAAGDDNAAAPIWQALFDQALGGQPAGEWPRPVGLHAVDVCALSGLLPSRRGPACPTVIEWFVAGTEPTATDTMTREVAVNRETGRLATVFTPPNLVERRVFTVFPPEAAQWATEHDILAPPTEYDPIRRVPTRSGGAAVTSPEPWAVVGRQDSPQGQWPVVGSAGGDDFAYYRLSWFEGLMPEAMQLIVARGETAV
ncbi:MAG TPA: transglycosylase domain-containing protein, partial [Promineifilum sp.]|nr:transglycosylase domain-containing protein [Promineifilum sp.]